jgi:hypothetical protein
MKAISRRLQRLETRLVPQEDLNACVIANVLYFHPRTHPSRPLALAIASDLGT